jgi:tetratricopeptide (TPR) repeat protein
MATPPRRLATLAGLILFTVAAAGGELAEDHYRAAREYMSEAKHSSNGIRLLWLGWMIGSELEKTIALDPNRLDARLDLVRFYVIAPRIVGGSWSNAREQARAIAKRDAALGAFASGYISYRAKEYGPARVNLRAAAARATSIDTKTLALMWLGWLSQETQQYDDAFAAFEAMFAADPKRVDALYEIGRTASFARRNLIRGEEAMQRYLASSLRTKEMPSESEARSLLARIQTMRGQHYENLR